MIDAAPPRFELRELAEAIDLLRLGRQAQARILRQQIADRRSRRPLHDVENIERGAVALERAAVVFARLAKRRDELPRWVVALCEEGVE